MAAACALGSGCGGGAAAPVLLHGSAASYVLRLDQLPTAGFVAAQSPQAVPAGTLSTQAAVVTALEHDGLTGAASAHYLNPVPVLATANGPLDIVATAAAFSTIAGAHAGLERLVAEVDARAGAGQLSAGDLGAESHAITERATASDGTAVVQVTVLWRVANLVSEIAVRGRQGGTGIGDAVIIARRQASGEH